MNSETRSSRITTLMLLAIIPAILAQDYAIDWYTVDGGAEMASTGGTYELSGTIGQPDARNHPEPMTGGSYAMTGGFWVISASNASQVASLSTDHRPITALSATQRHAATSPERFSVKRRLSRTCASMAWSTPASSGRMCTARGCARPM